MSYGNSTVHRRSGVNPSTVVGSAVASPTTTTGGAGLTRSNNNTDTAGSVHASPTRPSSSATSHGSQPFIHDPLHARREIIELTDSDTETPAPQPVAAASRTSKNPISRVNASPTTNGSRNKKVSTLLQQQQQQQQLQFQTTIPPTTTTTTHSASASPSIASLINPDTHAPLKKSKSTNPSPTNPYFPAAPTSTSAAPAAPEPKKQKLSADTADKSPKSSKPGTTTNSSAPSPKPARPPPPSGNGLLSGVLSGNAPEPELKAPNIYLHVPLNGEQNKYVNFARLAEERYGWAALNPKLARAKQALHLDSGDEMMLDGSDTESNADTAGEKAADQGPKKRQKRSYQDIYDKADPFIDDSEMLWEEQAATSKDGFFVYSGPLVPEGQKPQIERADGTVKRGRGRGRGSRGGATSTRGTGTTARKPRITKKEKEKLEKEKEERERFSVLAAAQAGKPIMPPR